jgi:RNA polymerase sigma factor (TIGR02999 family)
MTRETPDSGQPGSLGPLIDAAWAELRALAHRELRSSGGAGEGQEATSLLDEAIVRVLRQRGEIRNLSHLRGLTTVFLRQVIADRGRRRRVRERHLERYAQDRAASFRETEAPNLAVELAEALSALGEHGERKLACLTLSAVHGLTVSEISVILGISDATTERDLRFARAFVASRLERRG